MRLAQGGRTARGGLACVLFALTLAAVGAVRAEQAPLVFQSTDTPPFWSPSLPEHGMGGAILRLMSEAAGLRYSLEYLPVKRFRNSLAAFIVGDPDILLNPKRRAVFPIAVFRSAFFYYKPHHDVIEFRTLRDLQGHTLGVLRGTLEDKAYFVGNGIRVEESDSVESLVRKLKRGRIDFCILVDAAGQYTIKRLFPADRNDFVQVAIPGSVRPIAIMIDTETAEGREAARRYHQVLERTLHSQQYQNILEAFYGKDKVPVDRFEQLKKFEQSYASDWEN